MLVLNTDEKALSRDSAFPESMKETNSFFQSCKRMAIRWKQVPNHNHGALGDGYRQSLAERGIVIGDLLEREKRQEAAEKAEQIPNYPIRNGQVTDIEPRPYRYECANCGFSFSMRMPLRRARKLCFRCLEKERGETSDLQTGS